MLHAAKLHSLIFCLETFKFFINSARMPTIWHPVCSDKSQMVFATEGKPMSWTVSEERTVYVCHRRCEVRCRLWYRVSRYREGLLRYFLVGIEELE